MKSHIRESKASGSTLRRIERIVNQGPRAIRRQFVGASRRTLRQLLEGGSRGQ